MPFGMPIEELLVDNVGCLAQKLMDATEVLVDRIDPSEVSWVDGAEIQGPNSLEALMPELEIVLGWRSRYLDQASFPG